jgi:outer membrane protein TolC
VQELTASLNEMLGWPPDTELELVPPALPVEDVSLPEAIDQAMAANPEVVEAEQNVAKARAASSLAKLDYVPDVVVLGGYAYNGNAIPALPRDFSFIGLTASYTLFDFGKREHTIKERHAQVSMAETALELTKAKVAAGVKHSYFALERSRQLSEMTHRMASLPQLQKASFEEAQIAAARARVEAEMYQSDFDYLQALAQLKTLMGER